MSLREKLDKLKETHDMFEGRLLPYRCKKLEEQGYEYIGHFNQLQDFGAMAKPKEFPHRCKQATFEEIKDEFYPTYITDEDLENIKEHLNGK